LHLRSCFRWRVLFFRPYCYFFSLSDETYILRSISDLGAEGWHVTKRELAFSGPVLPCYAPGAVGIRKDSDGRWVSEKLYGEAGFRLVFRT
jgi:hypothetical protein